jgi:4-aminobutyrate aminotransferase
MSTSFRVASTLRTTPRMSSQTLTPLATRPFNTTAPHPVNPAVAHEDALETPVRSAAQWADFGREHVSAGLGRLRDHVIVKGQGLNVWTAEGKQLLDFTAGIGVTNLGQ